MIELTERVESPHQSGRGDHIPRLIVCHIADGSYEGTKSWFLCRESVTSSQYILGRDGRVCQCVPLWKMAWCNGTNTDTLSAKYYGYSTVPLVKSLGGNANQYSVSIECEGRWAETKGALSDTQLETLAGLILGIRDEVQAQYGHLIPLDREHVVGHCEVSPKTKPCCPGELFPWDKLMGLLGGDEAGGLYRIQVGAFRDKANAQAYLSTLKKMGVDGFLAANR